MSNTNTNNVFPLPAFFRITTAAGEWINYTPRYVTATHVDLDKTGRSGYPRRVSLPREVYLETLAKADYVEGAE